jgi:hypothetical protein
LLFSKLKLEDAEKYLTDPANKGFNVIQAMLLLFLAQQMKWPGNANKKPECGISRIIPYL